MRPMRHQAACGSEGDRSTAPIDVWLAGQHQPFARAVCFDTVLSSDAIVEPVFVFHAMVS